MKLKVNFNKLGDFYIDLPNTSSRQYAAIENYFRPLVNSTAKGRESIASAFQRAIEICPNENPSDLWHHVLYRIYIQEKIAANPSQSWVRTSGEALELALCEIYNQKILSLGLRLRPLIGTSAKQIIINQMHLGKLMGSSKIDIVLEGLGCGGSNLSEYGIIGIVHMKASLAERVSDDVPASRQIMAAGYQSILMTLDVKSFPPPHGDLVNRGEFGTDVTPSDKRKYIETHGEFSACFSYNTRTMPSPVTTASGRRIYVSGLSGTSDFFTRYVQPFSKTCP
jgi:hypothetical protein